jgi:hypothetical protein
MQARPLDLIKIFYGKIMFYSENMFDVGLKPLCEFYKIYEVGLKSFE